LIQELGEPYARLLEKAHSAGRDTLALEAQAMGFDHTELTARLLDHWGLPPTLANAVRWDPAGQGEEASPGPLREQRRILHLAELLARLLADGRRDVLPELLAAGRDYHAISPSQLDDLVDRLEDKVLQLANVLSLQLPGQLDYHDILVQAHGQLADIAFSAAGDLIAGGMPAAEDENLRGELQSLSDAAQRVGRAPVARRVVEHKPAAVLPADAPVESTFHVGGGTSVAACPPSSGLLGRLGAVVAACRQSRCPLSLLLVELSNADELVLKIGLDGVHEACRAVESLCRHVDQRYSLCLPHGDFAFALILADCDRQTAVRLGNQLIRQVGQTPSANPPDGHWTAQVSVGVASVALPPRNFPAHDLIDGASRCLYGSHASGGGVVKSIEIY
jgi:GGDEF domain-containing protein